MAGTITHPLRRPTTDRNRLKPGIQEVVIITSRGNLLVLFWAVSPYNVAMNALEVVIPRSDLCDEESLQS